MLRILMRPPGANNRKHMAAKRRKVKRNKNRKIEWSVPLVGSIGMATAAAAYFIASAFSGDKKS